MYLGQISIGTAESSGNLGQISIGTAELSGTLDRFLLALLK